MVLLPYLPVRVNKVQPEVFASEGESGLCPRRYLFPLLLPVLRPLEGPLYADPQGSLFRFMGFRLPG